MKDRNGVEIKIGDKAVLMPRSRNDCDIGGRIGTVRDIRLAVGALRGKPGLRIGDEPEDDDPEWSAWVTGDEITVVR